MAVIYFLRTIAFLTSVALSVIVLGVASDLTDFTTHAFIPFYWSFQALAIATAVLTLLTLPIMLIVDLMRPGTWLSKIVVELAWVFILWVLWLATAGSTSTVNATLLSHDCTRYPGRSSTACSEIQVTEAFAFINWLLLLSYTVLVLTFSVSSAIKGQVVWFLSVREAWHSDRADDVPMAVASPFITGMPSASQNGHLYPQPPSSAVSSAPAHMSHASQHGHSSPSEPQPASPLGFHQPPNSGYSPHQGSSEQGNPNYGFPGQGNPNPDQGYSNYPHQGYQNQSYPNPLAYQSQGPPAQQGYPNQINPNQGPYQQPVSQRATSHPPA